MPIADSLARALATFVRTPAQGDGDASPFAFPGDRGAILCLHGLTGTPFEVRPLGEALAREGFAVRGPVLAGHAARPEDLVATTWVDWLATAEAALDDLAAQNQGRPIGVIGFSTGALLALRLCRMRPAAIAAVAALSPPLRMKASQVRSIRWLNRLPANLIKGPLGYVPKRHGPDVQEPAMKTRNPGLPVMPLPALASLLALMQVVRLDLSFVTQPALVAHGQKDQTIPFEDALEVAGSLASETIERLWLPRSGHLIGIDVEKHVLTAALTKFFLRHLPANGATGAGDLA